MTSGGVTMTIVPIFASYTVSARCHWTCEYAFFDSVCDCKECNGLNHGRTAHNVSHSHQNNRRTFLDAGKFIDIWQSGPLRWFTESY